MGSIESKPKANYLSLLSSDENSDDSNEQSSQSLHNLDLYISLFNPDNENKKIISIKDIENEKTNEQTIKGNENGKDDDNINMNEGATKPVDDFIIIEKKKEQIFIINKNPKKKFTLIKRGRPQKKNISTILIKKHPSSADDNACRKIFNSCKKNSYDYITNLLPKELNIILHMPTIEKQMGYSYKNNRTSNFNEYYYQRNNRDKWEKKFMLDQYEFKIPESEFQEFKKKMYQIFLDSIPKRVPDYLKEKRDEYTHNKNMIDIIFKSDNAQCRIVKGLLSLTFLDFLKAYLNDQSTIKTKNGITYDITGFKTFGGCFNDCFKEAQKRVYKNHIFQIYESKTKDRKERRKK